MLRISSEEYRGRLESLQADIAEAGLDLFIVSAFDSLYYLTGAAFEPLERPFFLLIRPHQAPILLVPKLEHEHMKKAHSIAEQDIRTYWDYPAPPGRGWPDAIHQLIGKDKEIGVGAHAYPRDCWRAEGLHDSRCASCGTVARD